MENAIRQLLQTEKGTWDLDGRVAFQTGAALAMPLPAARSASDASDDAPDAEAADAAFSACVWQERLRHGFAACRLAAETPYDDDALEFFREWAKAEEEYAKALGTTLLAPHGHSCRCHSRRARSKAPQRCRGSSVCVAGYPGSEKTPFNYLCPVDPAATLG